MARQDPLRNFRFRLEIDGIDQAAFSEVAIGDLANDPIEYREGDEITHRPQAQRPDEVRQRHAQVGHHRLDRARRVAPANRRRRHPARRHPQDRRHSDAGRGGQRQGGVRDHQGLAVQVRPRPTSTARATRSPSTPSSCATRASSGSSDEESFPCSQTEIEFTLPKGYLDPDGVLHTRRRHAPGHRGGRDPAAEGPAGAAEPRLPDDHRAGSGDHPARRAA